MSFWYNEIMKKLCDNLLDFFLSDNFNLIILFLILIVQVIILIMKIFIFINS